MATDLAIRGGTVVDGSGGVGRRADVAISGGVITEIGPDLRGERDLDAAGCAVTPGFIDIHTHYDAQVFWDPRLRPSSYHGVTTSPSSTILRATSAYRDSVLSISGYSPSDTKRIANAHPNRPIRKRREK